MESEVLHTPLDKRKAGNGLPAEGSQRAGPRTAEADGFPNRVRLSRAARPGLWAINDVTDFEPAPVWGCYPKGFVPWATDAIQCRPSEVLHVCSGSLGREFGGCRVDLRAAAEPDVQADGRQLPFRDGTFPGVLIDPPYSVEYARELYDTDYPRPSQLLKEAARVVRPGGRIGFLHFLVPMVVKSRLRIQVVKGITTGPGYRIRAFTIFVRPQDEFALGTTC